MAENRESTILEVKLDAGKVSEDLSQLVTRIAALKNQQKALNDQIKAGNDIDGKYAEQLIRVKDQLTWTEKQAKGLSATTKLLNADTLTYSDSLNGERQKLADMQKAYDQLDREMRESEGGKAFLDAIKAQSDAVKQLEEETGRAQRNVGNYPQAWNSAIPALNDANVVLGKTGMSLKDLATNGTKAFENIATSAKAFGKAMLTPPVGLVVGILSAIVGFVNRLVAAFKKNDDAMTGLKKAFAVFEPIAQAIRKVFDGIATAISKVVNAISGVVGWILSKLIPGYKQASDAAQALVEAQDMLEERQRQFVVNEAKRSKDIARMREEVASATDGYTKTIRENLKATEKAAQFEQEYANAIGPVKGLMEKNYQAYQKMLAVKGDMSKLTKGEIEALKGLGIAESEFVETRVKASDLLSEAMELEKKTLQDRLSIARENLRILTEKAKQEEDTSDETKNKIAEARAAMYQAEEAYYTGVRKLQKEKNKFDEEYRKSQQKLADDLAKQRDTMRLRELSDYEKALQDLTDAEAAELSVIGLSEAEKQKIRDYYQKQRIDKIQEHLDELAAETLAKEKELQEKSKELLESLYEEEEEIEEEHILSPEEQARKMFGLDDEGVAYFMDLLDEGVNASEAKTRAIANQTQRMAKNFADSFGELGDAFSDMSDALGGFAENNETAAKAQKAFALTGIITNQAQSISEGALAIAKGVESAAGIPFPANIPAIISIVGQISAMVAGVMSSISQAKQIFSQANDAGNFSNGGTVGGTSYTGDKLIAHVNSREGIYTPMQANNLLQEIANNPVRGGMEQLTEAFTAAMEAMPAPVMTYEEFKSFEEDVTTYNELAKI